MPLSSQQKAAVESVIINSVSRKLLEYKRETTHMPFHTSLLGKNRMELSSFIHSLSTTFGMSIYEPVAKELAKSHHKTAENQVSAGSEISQGAQSVIQEIMNGLTSKQRKPNKINEIELIRSVCRKGSPQKVKLTKVDLEVVSNDETVNFIDIKTVKPNMGEFKGFKRTLLEWVAAYLYENPSAKINTLVAFPYNPYHPAPYERWTMQDMYDLKNEIIVADEFWNFLGGDDIYSDLLACFDKAGTILKDKIDQYFSKLT